MTLILFLVSLVGLWFAAELVIRGSVGFAHKFGLSDAYVGATLVAVGTSLPELFITVTATRKNESSLSLGNLIGSSTVNILLAVGGGSVIAPWHVGTRILAFDFPMLVLAGFLALFFLHTRKRLEKRESVVLLVIYVGYVLLRTLSNYNA